MGMIAHCLLHWGATDGSRAGDSRIRIIEDTTGVFVLLPVVVAITIRDRSGVVSIVDLRGLHFYHGRRGVTGEASGITSAMDRRDRIREHTDLFFQFLELRTAGEFILEALCHTVEFPAHGQLERLEALV